MILAGPVSNFMVDDVSQLPPEEAFAAGIGVARDAIDQLMGAPDEVPPEDELAEGLQEATPISPLSATKPGERIPAPGTSRRLEARPEISWAMKILAEEVTDLEKSYTHLLKSLTQMVEEDNKEALYSVLVKHNGADGGDADYPAGWVSKVIRDIRKTVDRLQLYLGKEDPDAPRLEEE